MRPRGAALAAALALAGGAPPALAAGSPLALARVWGGTGGGPVLAQRAIEREWPVRGDSGYVWFEGRRSETAALALSAALPGTGQLYAGKKRGFYFVAAEVLGWLGWGLLREQSRDLRRDARALAGSPEDSASAWSFERWEEQTREDAEELRRLYAADREAFEQGIAGDARYAPGWSSSDAQGRYRALRERSDRRLAQARTTEGALWVNHVLAALEAVRAARARNLAIFPGLGLEARGGWAQGGPVVRLALERRF